MTTGKYRPYAGYKKSGVEWLGKIPLNWNVVPLKRVCSLKTGLTPSSDNQAYYSDEKSDFPWIRPEDLNENGRAVSAGKYVSCEGWQLMRKVPAYSTLICCIGTIGKVGYIENEVSTNQQITAASFLYSPRYNFYLIQSARKTLEETATGNVIQILNSERLANIKFLLVPSLEADRIANFLDHETAKTDTLIEKQQQLIKLLKEKRQAVISHAVTKGLNTNAPMRDSGVEWLGEVPAHWEVTRAKFLFDFITSGSRGWAEFYSEEGELFFRITNLTRDTIDPKLESIQNVKPPAGSEGERSRIKLNDLLISITADLGSVCVANSEVEHGYVSQHVALCRPNKKIASSRWLGFFILSDMAKEQFIGSAYGGTKVQLSLDDIRELWIVRPSIKEQIEIANVIDEKLGLFEKLISMGEEEIKLLQERRTALISAAVTGKIDVRNWQAPSQTINQMIAA
jgi:type I restriction enzyme, S subunit